MSHGRTEIGPERKRGEGGVEWQVGAAVVQRKGERDKGEAGRWF